MALLAAIGCSEGAGEIATVTEWEVSPAPVVSIGVAEGEAAYELHRASDAIALRDGRIVVANSGSSELRVFDSAGVYLKSIGRQGSGPGEFRGTITLFPHAGDSLIAYDNGNGRFSVFDPDGEYVRLLEIEAGPFPWDDWMHAGAWVSGVRDASVRPCVAAALRAIPVPDVPSPPIRRAILDEAGRLWLRPLGSAESTSWRVYSIEGAPLGAVRLPAGFRPYHIEGGFVLGSRTGADDSEQIQLYRIAAPEGSAIPECKLPALAADSAVPPDLGGDLRNAVVAQEVHYADHQGYASHADSLRWSSVSGAGLTIVAVSEGGWAGVLRLPDGGPMCAIAVGDVTPAGWPEGAPQCASAPAP
ncbi:MAG TPA: 6-bladed beta-propeller [Gemmatimonadales bacterium]|nr:6-bladed beta-propeller [Gemmatimonadales bacterium]